MTDIYNICFYGGLILSGVFLVTAIVLFFVLRIPKVVGDLTGSTARRKIREMKAHAESITLDKSVTRKEQAKYYNVGTGKITVKESTVPVPAKFKNKKKTAQMTESGALVQTAKDEIEKSSGQYGSRAEVKTETFAQPMEDITEVLGAGRLAHTEDKTDVLSADGDFGGFDNADSGFDGADTDYGRYGDDSATEVLSSNAGSAMADEFGAGDDTETEVLTAGMSMPEEEADTVSTGFKPKNDTAASPKNRPGFTVLMDVMLVHTQDTI